MTLIEIAGFSDGDLADERRKRYFLGSMSEFHNCVSALLAVMVCIKRVHSDLQFAGPMRKFVFGCVFCAGSADHRNGHVTGQSLCLSWTIFSV